jgi:hypothetical protein
MLSTHLRLEPFLESQAGHLRKREDKASMSSRRTKGLHLLEGDLPLPNLILGSYLNKAIQPQKSDSEHSLFGQTPEGHQDVFT